MKAVLISSQTLRSMDSVPSHWPLSPPGLRGCLLPMPVLGCYLPMLLHISMLLLPQWCSLPEFSQLLPALVTTTHETKTFMPSNILLQGHQVMAMTQKVPPSFCSGPLFFMMGLIWGTEGNVALQKATAPSEIILGKYFWKLPVS